MNWPWVSRKALEALEKRADWAEAQLRVAEERLAKEREASAQVMALVEERAESERQKLFDRIVEMAGQAPIYAKPMEPQAPAPAPSNAPAVPQRVTFDDVHAAARRAMANGSFSLTNGRPN